MKKKQIIILSISIIILLIFLSEKQQNVSLDDTLIDITQFTSYKGLKIDWVSNGKRYNPYGFGEKSVVREGWSKNGSNYTSYRFFQHTLLYRNKIVAAFAFRLFSPNNVYKDEWPNYYDSSWDLTNKGTIDLNANRYIYYCGIGNEENCQIWNYWAQYDNYLVLFGLYDVKNGNTIKEFESFISQIDFQLADINN